MGAFKEYISFNQAISEQQLYELINRYPWFSTAREVRAAGGRVDGFLAFIRSSRAVSTLGLLSVDRARLTSLCSDEIIDRFLREDDLRIVASDGEPEHEVRTEADFADEDDLVSEELAEIYLAQGLRSEALRTYRKLSLLNPEKSVYFAGLIGELESK